MNAPMRPDAEVWFDIPTFAPKPASPYLALVVGICIGILASAGITFWSPAPVFRCAFQVAEVTP